MKEQAVKDQKRGVNYWEERKERKKNVITLFNIFVLLRVFPLSFPISFYDTFSFFSLSHLLRGFAEREREIKYCVVRGEANPIER